MKNQIDIETDFARVLVTEKDENDREWLFRYAIHQMVKEYTKEFGQDATNGLLYELESYHLKDQVADKLTMSRAYAMYEDIIYSDMELLQKSEALAKLMTQMEQEFHIAAPYDPEWEKDNKALISLYRIISESRQF